MATQPYLVPGMDLVALSCITKSDVQQAIAQAQPTASTGFIILGDSAPDVVAYPALARFIWGETLAGVLTGNFYFYNGISWVRLDIINTDHLIDGSVTIAKIKVLGVADPYDIIQVNSTATALLYISIVNAIINNSLPVTKLVNPADALNNYTLASLANVNQYILISAIAGYFNDNSVAVMKLVRGGTSVGGLLLVTSADGSIVTWTAFNPTTMIAAESIPVSKLLGEGLAGQAIRRNPSNNGWEFFSPVLSGSLPVVSITQLQNIGVSAVAMVFAAWTTMTLNTIDDPYSISGLAANKITLPPGWWQVSGAFCVDKCKARIVLYNTTVVNTTLLATPNIITATPQIVPLLGYIFLGETSELEIRYYAIDNGGGNFGVATGITANPGYPGKEAYVSLAFTKITF